MISFEHDVWFEKFSKCLTWLYVVIFQASNVLFDPLHNICCVDDKEIPKMAGFTGIPEFMERLPIQKALTNQHLIFRSHIEHF
ncbi:hypothetical protein Hanom_Chr06g00547431 [Helianthus anomalus]